MLRALTAAFVLLLATVGVLAAHQRLVSSSPADGDILDAVPHELRLVFAEPVDVRLTRLQLTSAGGVVALGAAVVMADAPTILIVPVDGRVGAGRHTLEWVTSGADGHVVRGSIDFEVAANATGLAAEHDTAGGDTIAPAVHHDPVTFPSGSGFGVESAGFVAIRWATFSALVVLLGALSFRLLVLPLAARRAPLEPEVAAAAASGAAALGIVAAALLLAAAGARLAAQSYALFGTAEAFTPAALATLLRGSVWAWGWWLQAGAALAALVGLSIARHPRAHAAAAGWTLAAVAAAALACTPALSGHAAATPGGAAPYAITASALHVLAAGGWLGGLLATMVIGLPQTRHLPAGRRPAAAATFVHAFSPVALLCVAVLVLTGIFAAWLHAGSLDALFAPGYGRVLLLKIGLLSVAIGTGAYNFLRVRPALGDDAGTRRLGRSATLELAAGLAVLLVTAVLVAMPTPMDLADAPPYETSSP